MTGSPRRPHLSSISGKPLRLFILFCLGVLTACAPGIPTGPAQPYTPGALPRFPVMGAALPAGTTRYDNRSLADLLVTLTHDLEWGAERPHLIRFEGPVSVGIAGQGARPYLKFIDRFLAQIRQNAGVPIARTRGGYNLVIRFVKGQDFRAKVPQHFCVVAPGLIKWQRFRQSPVRYGTRAFETQRSLDGMTIFIPDNASPYVVRTCIIEEVVQALGPANDLYGLGPSIFNDDAAHIWPTRLDYLMLRVLYSPEVRSGMNRGQTRAGALIALDRLNPGGRRAAPLPPLGQRTMTDWTKAVRAAFDRRKSRAKRVQSAERAVAIAAARMPGSAFHCRALSALARLGRKEHRRILPIVAQADRVCARAHGDDDVRVARIMLEIARLHYDGGNPAVTLALTENLAPRLAAFGQDERLTALYALRSAALRAIQQGKRSVEARRLAGEWGAYALGADHPNVRRWKLQ